MIVPIFDIEKLSSRKPYIRVYVNDSSLFSFLFSHDMLRDKYNFLALPSTKYMLLSINLPIKMMSKIPFVLAALSCEQLNKCLTKQPSIDLVKRRVENYYCKHLFKKLVSIFGNEKAWDEFEIRSKWKPKFRYHIPPKYHWPSAFVQHLDFMQYGINKNHDIHAKSICWSGAETYIKQSSKLSYLNDVSKRRIFRTLNKPNRIAIEDFRKCTHVLRANKGLLSEDGIEMLKDLNLVGVLL